MTEQLVHKTAMNNALKLQMIIFSKAGYI